MSYKYEIVKLGDLGNIVTGKTPSTKNSNYYGGSIPFLTPSDNMDGKYSPKTNRYLTKEGKNAVKNCVVPKGSISMSCIGSDLGKVVVNKEDLVTNQQINTLIPDQDVLNSDFAYYLLLPLGKYLNHMSKSSTAVPIVNKTQFSNCSVKIPPIEVQNKIANILSSFDKKIELNTHIISHLEELIMSVYKQYLQGSNLSECVASDVFDIFIGKTPPRKESEWFSFNKTGNVVWTSIKDMGTSDAYLYDSSEYLASEAVEKFNIKNVLPGSILLSFKLTIGRVKIAAVPMTTNEAIACFSSEDARKLVWIYPILKTYNYEHLGSTSSIAKAVNSKIIKAMPLPMPNDDVLDEYYKKVKPLYELMKSTTNENIVLKDLRDVLLPKLMSSEIEV